MSKPIESMHQVSENTSIAQTLQRARLATRVMLHCSVALLVALVFSGCGGQGDRAKTKGEVNSSDHEGTNHARVLRRGLPGEPRTLDPQLADDDFSFQIVRDLYEGLTAEDAFGKIVPGAASAWTVDETGTIYTFQLRPDAKWSNGDRTVASEFVQGMRRAVDPKLASGSAALLAVVKGASDIIAGSRPVSELGVIALGDSVVRIVLAHPAPFILQILSQPIAAPFHLGATSTLQVHNTSENAVYNGAYTLTGRVPGSYIDLARNPNYWNSKQVSIELVRYINVESQETELREYMVGQLDMTFTIPMSDLSRALQEFGPEVQMVSTLGTVYLALNLTAGPLKDNLELRQALAMAVDKEQIAKRLMMGVTPAYTFVATGDQ